MSARNLPFYFLFLALIAANLSGGGPPSVSGANPEDAIDWKTLYDILFVTRVGNMSWTSEIHDGLVKLSKILQAYASRANPRAATKLEDESPEKPSEEAEGPDQHMGEFEGSSVPDPHRSEAFKTETSSDDPMDEDKSALLSQISKGKAPMGTEPASSQVKTEMDVDRPPTESEVLVFSPEVLQAKEEVDILLDLSDMHASEYQYFFKHLQKLEDDYERAKKINIVRYIRFCRRIHTINCLKSFRSNLAAQVSQFEEMAGSEYRLLLKLQLQVKAKLDALDQSFNEEHIYLPLARSIVEILTESNQLQAPDEQSILTPVDQERFFKTLDKITESACKMYETYLLDAVGHLKGLIKVIKSTPVVTNDSYSETWKSVETLCKVLKDTDFKETAYRLNIWKHRVTVVNAHNRPY